MAAQDWWSPEWCELSPAPIVFEWKHSKPQAYYRALRALQQSELCQDQKNGGHFAPFRVVAETEENVFITRAPPAFWHPLKGRAG